MTTSHRFQASPTWYSDSEPLNLHTLFKLVPHILNIKHNHRTRNIKYLIVLVQKKPSSSDATVEERIARSIVAGSAFGPYPFGYIADVTGSFLPAFRYLATLPLLGALLVLRYGKNPTRQTVSSSSTRGIEGDRSRDMLYDAQGEPGENGVQVEMFTTEAGLLGGEDRNTTDASADQGRSAVVISALHT